MEPAESALPLNISPICSVVDFSESGCVRQVKRVSGHIGHVLNDASHLERGGGLVGEGLASSVRHVESKCVINDTKTKI